jgi:mono/diheme cytochrome c family protein
MTGRRAIALVAATSAGLFLAAAAVNYTAQAREHGGPSSFGSWIEGAVRPPGPLPRGRGAALFQRYGCRACHTLDGYGASVGPVLNGVRERKTRDEIIRWLDDPARIKPGTKMPRFHFTAVEEQVLADFLMTR